MLSPRKGWVKKQVKLDFEKMFKPVTSKLDDVMGPGPSASAASNLPDGSLRSHAQKQPARRKKANLEGIDYFPDVDPFEDMDVEGLFDEAVPPQAEKQIPAGPPPSYDEMIKELGDDHHLNMKKMTLPIMLWHQVMKAAKLKKQINYSAA